MSNKPEYRYFGKNVKRLEAEEIVTGKTIYTDDVQFQDLLHVKVLRCPYASAKIKRMDIDAALRVPGVTSVNYYGNLPEQCRNWGINAPAIVPVLHDYGCYAGDVVAVIAAETEQAAEEARDLIKVEYEVLKPVLTVKEAIQPGAPLVHPDTFPTGNIVFPVIPYVGEDISLVLGGVAPVPYVLDDVAALLKGKKPTDELAAQAGALAISKAAPMEKNAYKVNGIQAMVERFVASLAR